MLPDEPCVPTARERNRIQSSEWLTCAILLCAQRGNARFNLCSPFSELRLCFVSRCVRRQLEMRFTSYAIKARVLCAYRGRRPRCPAHGDHVIRSMTTGAAHELDGAVGFIF
jgi:hypothetical protein